MRESQEVVERYETLKKLGREIFRGFWRGKKRHYFKGVELAKDFLAQGAQITDPPVWASLWEHIFIAPELGKRLAKALQGYGVKINSAEVELLLWVHDIGRLVTPGTYLRTDLIGNRLLLEVGFPRDVVYYPKAKETLMAVAETLDLNEAQLKFKQPLNLKQLGIAEKFFASLDATQRVIDLADNLGKRTNGGLFTWESFLKYLETQEDRYFEEKVFSSEALANEKRKAGAVLQAFLIKRTLEWLEELGVDFEKIRESLSDYGPKFVIVARHGEVGNPKGIVYNRDSLMNMQEILHLSKEGRNQLVQLARIIRSRFFRVVRIHSSPETRAIESTALLMRHLEVRVVFQDNNLQDNYAPGPYYEGMLIPEYIAKRVTSYDKVWRKYKHETPRQIIVRMAYAFLQVKDLLKVGEAAILVSHGDPTAWLINKIHGLTPKPEELRDSPYYLPKGSAFVAVFGPKGELFTSYFLVEKDVNKLY